MEKSTSVLNQITRPDITPATKDQAQQFADYLRDKHNNTNALTVFMMGKHYFVVSFIKEIPCNIVIYWVGKNKIDLVDEVGTIEDYQLSNIMYAYYRDKIKPYETYRTYK